MRLLLDTHAYFWWARGYTQLSSRARSALSGESTDVFLSAVVLWELATKDRLGKWPDAEGVLADIEHAITRVGLLPLPISLDHARRAGRLPSAHKDPFDRMLAAQAIAEGLAVVTRDPAFGSLGCEVFW